MNLVSARLYRPGRMFLEKENHAKKRLISKNMFFLSCFLEPLQRIVLTRNAKIFAMQDFVLGQNLFITDSLGRMLKMQSEL